MVWTILANAADAATQPTTQPESALMPAIQISGVAMLGIFIVMLVFAAAITVVGRLFPDKESE